MKVQLNVGQTQSLLLYDSLLLSVATAFEKRKKRKCDRRGYDE